MAEQLYGLEQADVDWLRALKQQFSGGLLLPRQAKPTQLFDRNYAKVRFRNDYAGTIPAHGVMAVTGCTAIDSQPVLTCDRPGDDPCPLYLVNGPEDVTQSVNYGWGTFLWHAGEVLYDSGSGTPAYGELWGPKSGQFTLVEGRHGFTIHGNNQTDPPRTTATQYREHIYSATLETATFSATTSEVQKNFTSVNESNYYGSGHLTLSSGIVTSANTAIYDWIFTITGYMGYVRNDYGRLLVYFQYRQSSAAPWGGGTLLQHTVSWPDVAVLAAPGELNYFRHTTSGVGLVMAEGAQVRITAQVEYATTAPSISVGANVNLRETRNWMTAGEAF